MKATKKIKHRVQEYADAIAIAAADKAAGAMLGNFLERLAELNKSREALAILDKIGEAKFKYASIDWAGRLRISRAEFMRLNTGLYKTIGKDRYESIKGDVLLMLDDLGRAGYEVVSCTRSGAAYEYFLKRRETITQE